MHFENNVFYLAKDEHVVTLLVGHPIDGLFRFVWAINLFEVLFHYFRMYRYLFLRIFKSSIYMAIIGGIKLKKVHLWYLVQTKFIIQISQKLIILIHVYSYKTYRTTTLMAIFFSFDIIEIDLFNECIVIVNSEFFKKWFPNLVDVANNDWRKKYFCQGNCHCVNCCNNLWKSKMWLMFNAFKKSFTFITRL